MMREPHRLRPLASLLVAVTLGGTDASAQESANAAATAWLPSASVYAYIVPDSRDYLQPAAAVDHTWLHLEARYNYESLDAASLWAGYNLSAGKKVTAEFTPMVGGVFGSLDGVATGYELSLGWWKLELSSQTEYVFDFAGPSGNFLYTWSQLSVTPVAWLQAGLVVQRTKVYQTDRDIQRGFLVGVSYRRVGITTYVFNPDDRPTVVLGLELTF